MSRQDINVNAGYGEVETTDNLTNKALYDFIYLGEMPGMDNDNYCYGEISVPEGFDKKYSDKYGIYTKIPYLPVYKELLIRFSIQNNNGSIEYLINRTNNKVWFPIYIEDETEPKKSIKLSEFRLLNEEGHFNLIFDDGALLIYSGNETDFIIKAALPQNEVFLLKAFAGNLYQHPTTGVGLIEFLHGNFENTGLAMKLQQEFNNDKMVVIDAYMDSNTGELILNVKEKNG